MRRRWKVLAVVLGAVALLVGLLSLLPPRDDGLDWIRKYGGIETVEPIHLNYWNPAISPRNLDEDFRGYRHSFRFRVISSKSIRELNRRLTKELSPTVHVMKIDHRRAETLVIERYEPRPWIERQWILVERTLGFR
jgi:hypothetical protein